MIEFITIIISNPLTIFTATMSLLAAVGFLMFLWGFTGYILAHGDFEHQTHARVQIVSGFAFFLTIAILWEVLRWLAGLFA